MFASLIFAFIFVNIGFSAEKGYKIINLGTLGEAGDYSRPMCFTDDNKVIGIYSDGLKSVGEEWTLHVFTWDEKSGMQDVGVLPRRYKSESGELFSSGVTSINESGQMAGDIGQITPGGINLFHQYACCWDLKNGFVDIFYQERVESESIKINKSGQIIGWKRKESGSFFWDINQGVRFIDGRVQDINDSGVVVGKYGDDGFIWKETIGMVDIGTPLGYFNFTPLKITNSGKVIGIANINSIIGRDVFIWDEEQGFVFKFNHQDVSEGLFTTAIINDASQIIVNQRNRPYMIESLSPLAKESLPIFSGGSKITSINNNGWMAGISDFDCPYKTTLTTLWVPVNSDESTLSDLMRGDVNSDQALNITDALVILNHLFQGKCLNCSDVGDVNNDDLLNLSDAVYLLGYLFKGGLPPAGDPIICISEY